VATAELSDLHDGCIMVQTVWNEKELIKQVPGAGWDATAKSWWLPATWVACVQLRGVFRDDLRIGPYLREWATVERKRVELVMSLRERIDVDD
jgi:hypothetical protein